MTTSQRFSILGGEKGNVSDSDSKAIDFRLLENCYADRKIGKIVKREGSDEEAITGTLGIPLGCGELLIEQSDELIPTQRILLHNFSGSAFRSYKDGSYSSVTIDGNTSFSSTKKNTFFQGGDTLFIAGGRPAFYVDGATVERVGIPAPITAPSVATGGGTGLTGSFQYAYTFYDSTSGRESDLSPLSSTVSPSNQDINLTSIETTVAAANVDKKRIYRTQNNGTLFYLVTEVTLATTTYTDSTLDSALGVQSPDIGDHALPPDNSYICAYFNKRMWWVDATQPNKIVYSKPHIGSDNDLHYYPPDNYLITDAPVTAFLVLTDKMLVFHPRSISYIQGFGTDLSIQNYIQGVGTMFSQGAATNGELVLILSEEGLVALGGQGKVVVSRPIDDPLRDIMNHSYTDDVHVAVCWSTNLRQFLFMVSAVSIGSIPWIVSGSGTLAEWVDSDTGQTAEWEDSISPSGEAIARFRMWGWSPETDFMHTYKWGQIEDLNSDAAYAVWLLHPHVSSDTLELTQDRTYMGFYDGTEGRVLALFRRDKSRDGESPVVARWLTSRVKPGDPNSAFKRVRWVRFGEGVDPTKNAGSTLQYLRDIDDPEDISFPDFLEEFTDDGDIKIPTKGKIEWMHLYGTDTNSPSLTPLLSEFTIGFIERNHRNNR